MNLNYKVFWIVFITIFLAELGDKTQLAIFNFSINYKDWFCVFLGGSFALILTTFLGAIMGKFLMKFHLLKLISGIIFIIIGIYIIIDFFKK